MFGGDDPEAGDLTRAVLSRARSKIAVGLADEAYRGALWSVLRTELGECVTRVSAFAAAVLEEELLSLDDLAWMIEPARDWPWQMHDRRSMAGRGRMTYGGSDRRPGARRSRELPGVLRRHGFTLHLPDGGRLRLHVVEDSIEVAGHVAAVGVRSRFGVLRLRVPGSLPPSLVRTCIGRPAEAIVDVRALIGRAWPVVGVEVNAELGTWTLIVETGSRPYRMPWVR